MKEIIFKYAPALFMVASLLLLLALIMGTRLQVGKTESLATFGLLLLSSVFTVATGILFMLKWNLRGISTLDGVLGGAALLVIVLGGWFLWLLRDVFSSRGI